jgi:hypothetical protein
LRKAHPIFNHKNSNLKTWLNGSVKKIQYDYEGKHAFVAGNFDMIPKEVSIELPHKGSWHHVIDGFCSGLSRNKYDFSFNKR